MQPTLLCRVDDAPPQSGGTQFFVHTRVAALAGCGRDTGTSDQHVHDGGDDHEVIEPLSPRQIDADQTAVTAMQMILSWQPAVDESKTALIRVYRGSAATCSPSLRTLSAPKFAPMPTGSSGHRQKMSWPRPVCGPTRLRPHPRRCAPWSSA